MKAITPTFAHFVSLSPLGGSRCACGLEKPVPQPLLMEIANPILARFVSLYSLQESRLRPEQPGATAHD